MAYGLINSLGFLIAGCYSFWVIFKKFKIKIFFPGKKALIKFTKDSMQFFWSRASYSVYTTSNAFILGLVTNNTIVGFYVAAEKIYKAIRFMYQPIVRVLYPYMSRSKNIILFKKFFWTIITLNSISCLFLVLVSKKLVVLIFGTGFQSSAIIFLYFMIALFFVVPSILLGYPLLAAFGKANYANNSVIIEKPDVTKFTLVECVLRANIVTSSITKRKLSVRAEDFILFKRTLALCFCLIF